MVEKLLPAGGVIKNWNGQRFGEYEFLHGGPCIHRGTQSTNRIIARGRSSMSYCDTKKGKRKASLRRKPIQPW